MFYWITGGGAEMATQKKKTDDGNPRVQPLIMFCLRLQLLENNLRCLKREWVSLVSVIQVSIQLPHFTLRWNTGLTCWDKHTHTQHQMTGSIYTRACSIHKKSIRENKENEINHRWVLVENIFKKKKKKTQYPLLNYHGINYVGLFV